MIKILSFKNIFFTILLLASTSCNKEDLKWDLDRNNSFDVNFNEPCILINCESLINTTTYVDVISPSSTAAWYIGSGYTGNGFALTQSCYGGYIEFSINLSNTSKITFWTKSINPGYSNRTPEITVDGITSNTTMIDGSESYTNWMLLETQNILPGNHTIRINFTHVSAYYSYYIDEIEIWCQ
jgi:hypothetical protein|tara:strand:- start:364 stop:912 length:549 start_codon:yes stop_codon:yes gene_type:complete